MEERKNGMIAILCTVADKGVSNLNLFYPCRHDTLLPEVLANACSRCGLDSHSIGYLMSCNAMGNVLPTNLNFFFLGRRSWVLGHTIVTITATAAGWAEVQVRRSTGRVRGDIQMMK